MWSSYYACHPSIIMDNTPFHSQECPRLDDKFLKILSIYLLHWVLVGTCGTFLAAWGIFHCRPWAALWLWHVSSRACGLSNCHRLSCPMASEILVPWWGIEPASSALEGEFLTTGSPGKSPDNKFYSNSILGFMSCRNSSFSHWPIWWQFTCQMAKLPKLFVSFKNF